MIPKMAYSQNMALRNTEGIPQRFGDGRDWFFEKRFGMFVHWGLYSIPGRGEWWMWWEKTTPAELNRLAAAFNPDKYKPSNWIRLARQAGMKYIVLTTRHHDGFSLFDSKVSDFTTTRTACGRDLVKEYVAACRKHGMPVGLYYSLLDWRFDAYHKGPREDPAGWPRQRAGDLPRRRRRERQRRCLPDHQQR